MQTQILKHELHEFDARITRIKIIIAFIRVIRSL